MTILDESRYDRQERISWWDQAKLRNSRVLVVGAGALGNELVKNLALVGVGTIEVVDMDLIEHTNLARCVFFREGDEGKPKAQVLATAAQALNSEVRVSGHFAAVQSLGSGYLREFDLILGGLDNREARLWVNRACRRLGLIWIDGAIEGLQGVVQAFDTHGACYECTLTEVDWKILSHRRSCALLGVQDMLEGKTPTNATTASLIAAIQVQEAIKFLVGRQDILALLGKQWIFLGEPMATFVSEIVEDEYCLAHEDQLEPDLVVRRPDSLLEVIKLISSDTSAVLEFPSDLLVISDCEECHAGGSVGLRALAKDGHGVCQVCKSPLKAELKTSVSRDDPILRQEFGQLVWPKCELIYVRDNTGRRCILIWGEYDES